MKTKIVVLGLVLSSLLGCNSESNKNLVPVEVEYKVPNSDVVQKKTIMVEETKFYGDTVGDWSKRDKYRPYYFCNGGIVYAVEGKNRGGYSYPLIKRANSSSHVGTSIAYYLCNVETGEITNV